MKEKKEFVSLLENSHLFLSKKSSQTGHKSIIKNRKTESHPRIEQVEWNEVHESAPKVRIIEQNGRIEAIKFHCKCGCNSVVKIEYDSEKEMQKLN